MGLICCAKSIFGPFFGIGPGGGGSAAGLPGAGPAGNTRVSASTAQLVPAAEIHESRWCWKPLSIVGWKVNVRRVTCQVPSSSCRSSRKHSPRCHAGVGRRNFNPEFARANREPVPSRTRRFRASAVEPSHRRPLACAGVISLGRQASPPVHPPSAGRVVEKLLPRHSFPQLELPRSPRRAPFRRWPQGTLPSRTRPTVPLDRPESPSAAVAVTSHEFIGGRGIRLNQRPSDA